MNTLHAARDAQLARMDTERKALNAKLKSQMDGAIASAKAVVAERDALAADNVRLRAALALAERELHNPGHARNAGRNVLAEIDAALSATAKTGG